MTQQHYPRIPVKTWWALRNRFKLTMPPKVTRDYLCSVIGISKKVAENIMPQLKAIKLIDSDGSINARTSRWRDDEAYADVCQKICREVYPPSLLKQAPGPETDHGMLTNWFMSVAGVGKSSAQKMARFYQLVSRAEAAEDLHLIKTAHENNFQEKPAEPIEGQPLGGGFQSDALQSSTAVQLNLQIVLPPEASVEQIDAIFAGAAKHFKQFDLSLKKA